MQIIGNSNQNVVYHSLCFVLYLKRKCCIFFILICFSIMYLGPSESDCCAPLLLSATDVPGLDTDALLTCPLPLAPVEPPRVSSDTALAKLIDLV